MPKKIGVKIIVLFWWLATTDIFFSCCSLLGQGFCFFPNVETNWFSYLLWSPSLVFPFKELVERACVVNLRKWGKYRALLGELGSKLKLQSSTFIESALCTFARGRGSKNLAKIALSHTLHWMGHLTVGTKGEDPFYDLAHVYHYQRLHVHIKEV